MRILDRSVYVGPSLYARFPVIRLELDLGALEAWPTGRLGARFVDALAAALPGLAEHGCSYREPGGFFRRMREGDGTWLGHVLEHVAIELQNIAGEEVTFGKTRSAGAARRLHRGLRVRAARRRHCRRRARAAAAVLAAAGRSCGRRTACPPGWNWAEARDQFIRFAQRRALGPSTASLVRAAEARGIPWLRLNDQSLVQLGHGKYQQRIQATVTGRTPHIAVELASDKEETNKILAGLGLPVPQAGAGAERRRRRCAPRGASASRWSPSPTTAITAAASPSGSPPRRRWQHGFNVAREHSRSVIVETFLEGDDHRLLVVNGELVAATRRTPGHVVGDGEHTVAQLIEIVNQDPRRGVGHEKVLTRLELDAQAQKMLERAGLTRALGARRGTVRVPALHRQPVDRRHRHRRHRRHPPRQPRDGRARGARHRPGRRRRRLPVEEHHRELPQDRRRHLRGERRPRLPHARGAERGHPARRGRPGDRHAVPAGRSRARADRRDHRHQRQDHHRAHAGAHHQDGRLHARGSPPPTASTSTGSAPCRAT